MNIEHRASLHSADLQVRKIDKSIIFASAIICENPNRKCFTLELQRIIYTLSWICPQSVSVFCLPLSYFCHWVGKNRFNVLMFWKIVTSARPQVKQVARIAEKQAKRAPESRKTNKFAWLRRCAAWWLKRNESSRRRCEWWETLFRINKGACIIPTGAKWAFKGSV